MDNEKIKSIIRFRQEQPTKTLQQIGDYFGVSKPYIHKVLKQNSIPTTRVRTPKLTYCAVCEKPISKKVDKAGHKIYYVRKTCVGKCTFDYYNKELKCAYCRQSFLKKRQQIINRDNFNKDFFRNNLTKYMLKRTHGSGSIFLSRQGTFMFCSQHCLWKAYKSGIYSRATEEFNEIMEEIDNEMVR